LDGVITGSLHEVGGLARGASPFVRLDWRRQLRWRKLGCTGEIKCFLP